MRILLSILFSFFFFCLQAQTKMDSIRLLQQTVQLYDLDFTEAELDSMIGGINSNLQLYKGLHRTMPANDVPYPFAFHPAPLGYKIPTKKIRINWNIPYSMELPANKNELAFYSLPQLASLIINKKISSVELTKFFIERLKKWGDTLQCVITLTEDLAMKQAKQADKELSEGYYRGPLHGIPYGLKDLFAVKNMAGTIFLSDGNGKIFEVKKKKSRFSKASHTR